MFRKALEMVFVLCHSPLPSVSSFAIYSKLGFFWSYSYLVQHPLSRSPNSWEMVISAQKVLF